MGKAIRILFGLLFFFGMSYYQIQTELDHMERAAKLMKSGQVAPALIDDAEITTRRAYLIPIYQDGRLDYHFKTQSGEEIQASQSVQVASIKALSSDGKTYSKLIPIPVSYLPEDPSVNLPASELEDQSGFHWMGTLFYCSCFGMLGIIGPFRMRRWATSYSQRRMNAALEKLKTEDGPGIYHGKEEKVFAQAEAPMPDPVKPAPVKPTYVAPRALPKAAGAARPVFGKRA